MKLIWDIEANGFLQTVDTLWMSVFIDVDTQQEYVFTDHDDRYPNVSESFVLMDKADQIIGHNLMRYDIPAFEKLTGYTVDPAKIVDTLILSRLNKFTRGRHSLKVLGETVGVFKDDYQGGFDEYNQEMLDYCIQDCKTNLAVYNKLLNEIEIIKKSSPNYDDAIAIEHKMSYWTAKQVSNGWMINEDLLNETINKIKEEVSAIENRVEPKLGTMEILIDKEPRTAKYRKDGTYTQATARILGDYLGRYVDPVDSLSDNPPIEPGEEFQRSQVVEARLGNQDHLKKFLETIGWAPTQWNWKRINGDFIKICLLYTSPSPRDS